MSEKTGHAFVLMTCDDKLTTTITEEIQSVPAVTKVESARDV